MEAAKEVLLHVREEAGRGLEAFHAAPLPLQMAGYIGGAAVTLYAVYCVWFYGGTRRVRSKVSLKGKTVIITGNTWPLPDRCNLLLKCIASCSFLCRVFWIRKHDVHTQNHAKRPHPS